MSTDASVKNVFLKSCHIVFLRATKIIGKSTKPTQYNGLDWWLCPQIHCFRITKVSILHYLPSIHDHKHGTMILFFLHILYTQIIIEPVRIVDSGEILGTFYYVNVQTVKYNIFFLVFQLTVET